MGLGFRFWLWSMLTGSKLKAYELEGRRLLATGNHLAALNLYREVVREWPDRPDGYWGLSEAYRAMGLRPEATREATIADSLAKLENDPDNLDARLELASALMDKELYSRAAFHLEHALKLAPTKKEVLKLAAQAFSKNRNYSQAVKVLSELVQQEPLEAAHYEALAKNLRAARRNQQAAKVGALAQALRDVAQDPGNPEVVDRAVRQFLASGQRSQALMLVERSLHDYQEQAGLHRLYGEILLEERRIEEAIAALEKAVKLDSIDIRAHTLLGRAYQRAGELEKSEHHFELVKFIEEAKQNKDPLEACTTLVKVLIDAGNPEQARQQAEKLAREHPDDWRAPYVLGMVLRAQGNRKEAIYQLQQAMKQNHLAPEPHLEMALLQSEAGEVLEAVGEARKAVNLSPRDPEIRRILAGILRTHGYLDQAVEEEELAEAFAAKKV